MRLHFRWGWCGRAALLLLVLTILCSCQSPAVEVERRDDALTTAVPVKPVNDAPSLSLECVPFADLQKKLIAAAAKTISSTVAVYPTKDDFSASGCLIRSDGLILTAAHVVKCFRPGDGRLRILLHDGREAFAVPYGCNYTTDMAVIKIVEPKDTVWPYTPLAHESPRAGGFLYLMGHPEQKLAGRAAQLRLGQVKYRRNDPVRKTLPVMIVSDANIQPGDSGCPVFNLAGHVVGVGSSAGGLVGYNRFVPIELYYRDHDRFMKKETWGDIEKGPTKTPLIYKTDSEGIALIHKELQRRLKLQYPPVMALAEAHTGRDGQFELTPQELVDVISTDVEPITLAAPFSLGMDSPELVKPISTAGNSVKATVLALGESADAAVGYAVAVSTHRAIAKLSQLTSKDALIMTLGDKRFTGTVVAEEPAWDLALIDCGRKAKFIPVAWADSSVPVVTGTLLVGYGPEGRCLGWGAVSGPRLPEKRKEGTPGPLVDKTRVSTHRGPYDMIIPHDVPVYANDMGSLCIDLKGRVIGFNITRKSRTQAMMIPAGYMAGLTETLMMRADVENK